MAAIRMEVETSLSPDAVKAALIDFSDRRPDIWPGLAREQYKVISVGDTSAVVREGSPSPKSVWAIEDYDWSRPGVVRWTVKESGFCTPGSYVEATLEERSDGGTVVHLEWDRTGVGVLAKLLVAMIRLSGGKPVRSSFEAAVRQMEKRAVEGSPPGADPST